jgi:hypothetical protein
VHLKLKNNAGSYIATIVFEAVFIDKKGEIAAIVEKNVRDVVKDDVMNVWIDAPKNVYSVIKRCQMRILKIVCPLMPVVTGNDYIEILNHSFYGKDTPWGNWGNVTN